MWHFQYKPILFLHHQEINFFKFCGFLFEDLMHIRNFAAGRTDESLVWRL